MREDPDAIDFMQARFAAAGIRILTDHSVLHVDTQGNDKTLVCEHDGGRVSVPFDAILVAVGRKPTTAGLGLSRWASAWATAAP